MALEKGSLVFANYTAKVKDTGETIETTLEDQAKKLNVFDPSRKYAPRLIAVGEGWVLSGLDEEMGKMDVGERKEVELPPEKAFGKRDPSQTRMIPLRKFGEKAADMATGDTVEVDNRVGVVRFIGSGRAQVDFNHRLAGKNIVYDLEIVRKVETEEDRLRALIDRRFGVEGGKVGFMLLQDSVSIEIPEDLFLLDGLQIIKRGISGDVFKFVPRVREVAFSERFVNKKPEEKKEEPTPAPAVEKPVPAEEKPAEAPEQTVAQTEKEVAPAPKPKRKAPAKKPA